MSPDFDPELLAQARQRALDLRLEAASLDEQSQAKILQAQAIERSWQIDPWSINGIGASHDE